MSVTDIPLHEATIAELRTAMLTGVVSAHDLSEAYLAQIAAHDQSGAALNAMVIRNDDALAQARVLDERLAATGNPAGPLHGVPIVIKDCLETTTMPTSVRIRGVR